MNPHPTATAVSIDMLPPEQRVALTICIPTYNRGARVHALVLYLQQNLLPHTDDVEIIVVNNCSNDDTQTLIEPLVSDKVRLVNRVEFLPTAEENMFESLEFCRGDYVWFHGDDEIPICDTIFEVVRLIKADAADVFIFNSRLIDDDGAPLAEHMVPMHGDHFDVTGDALVRSVGFMFMLAGISNVIMRREYADVKIAREALTIQKIYSHVCWILECFSPRRARIVNRPLVFYRHAGDAQQFEHFRRFAKRHELGDYHFWGIGLALQLRHLISRGVFKPSTVAVIFEGRRDGTRFKFLHDCIHKIFCQVEASVVTGESRNKVESGTFRTVRDFIVSCDLFSYDLFVPIERIQEIAEGKRSRSELRKWTRLFHKTYAKHDDDPYRNCRRCHRHGFDIYEMPIGWVAVDPDVPGGVPSVLAVLDVAEAPPYVWVDRDFDRLVARLTEYRRASSQIKDFVEHRARGEWLHLGRQFLGVSQDVLEQYVARVEISRQTTVPVRVAANLVFNPLRRAGYFGRRVLRRILRRW
ncbi:glycosyltransferase family 2 protein [Trinickia acidisoli]|uniref:glycosyltransferase family 2 protein n=1 Tax=Trinickia acidisoli TaxID=2767482 RepID=UPI001A8F974F|nr:glycosyltransferase [Trinickia acidisoli]